MRDVIHQHRAIRLFLIAITFKNRIMIRPLQIIFAIPFLFAYSLHAQSLSPVIVSPAGNTFQSENISLEWTLGETSIGYFTYGNKALSEGFHQPTLSVLSLTDKTSSDVQINVFPNPVLSTLKVTMPLEELSKALFSLTDENGRIVSVTISNSENSRDIDMSQLKNGYYFLRVNNSQGVNIRSFKILKIK